jgi:hypothetical protein
MRICVKGWFVNRDLSHAEAEAYHLRKAARLAGSPFIGNQQSQAHHLEEARRNREWADGAGPQHLEVGSRANKAASKEHGMIEQKQSDLPVWELAALHPAEPNSEKYFVTHRLSVPGGWLYRTTNNTPSGQAPVAMAFVPYPTHWGSAA